MVERAHGTAKDTFAPMLLAPILLVVLALAPAAGAAVPDIHAHRGGTVENGKARFAEESIRAYRSAARHGFVLEVDAKLTEDGVPVAIHDATLDRTTNCSGELRTFTLAELRSCRTDVLGSPGSPLPTRGARRTVAIATIAGVLELAKLTGAEVNLEIKNAPTDPDYDTTPAFANKVMDVVVASRLARRQLIVQSFIPANLDVARQRMPGVTTSLLSLQSINEGFLQLAAANDYDLISPEWPVTADYVRRAHDMALDVAPFTLDAVPEVRAARAAGVDALITDDPLMAGRALGLRPARFFDAFVFAQGRRLIATGDLLTPRGVSARQGCRGAVTVRLLRRSGAIRTVHGRLNRNCEYFFGAGRKPGRLASVRATVHFEGNARVLPELEGPERVLPRMPNFSP
jgi:glycerophosphoryl diester phosphodiesterase